MGEIKVKLVVAGGEAMAHAFAAAIPFSGEALCPLCATWSRPSTISFVEGHLAPANQRECENHHHWINTYGWARHVDGGEPSLRSFEDARHGGLSFWSWVRSARDAAGRVAYVHTPLRWPDHDAGPRSAVAINGNDGGASYPPRQAKPTLCRGCGHAESAHTMMGRQACTHCGCNAYEASTPVVVPLPVMTPRDAARVTAPRTTLSIYDLKPAAFNAEWAREVLRNVPDWAYPRQYQAAVLAVAETLTARDMYACERALEVLQVALRAAQRAR